MYRERAVRSGRRDRQCNPMRDVLLIYVYDSEGFCKMHDGGWMSRAPALLFLPRIKR